MFPIVYVDNKILDCIKLKAFSDNILNVAKSMISAYIDRVENIVRKGENTGNQHFLLFPKCFPKPCGFWAFKS